jgi:drug/metabolite transporter (DMT)-like permease
VAALLALCGALCWGLGDFLGGLASRRLAVLAVLALSQGIGLAGLLVWVLIAREPVPHASELLPAAGAGLAGALGLAALYRGLAVGAMGIVAPISAAGPLVPLVVDAVNGVVPSALQSVGILLVLAGIATLSLDPSAGRAPFAAGAGLAVLAALSFGTFVVGIDAGSDESAAWAVVAARASSVALVLVVAAVASASLRVPREALPALVAIGVFDTSANVLIAAATTEGAAGIVGVLSALYPVVTVVLARIVLAERLARARRLGGVLALGGAALVAAG